MQSTLSKLRCSSPSKNSYASISYPIWDPSGLASAQVLASISCSIWSRQNQWCFDWASGRSSNYPPSSSHAWNWNQRCSPCQCCCLRCRSNGGRKMCIDWAARIHLQIEWHRSRSWGDVFRTIGIALRRRWGHHFLVWWLSCIVDIYDSCII